MITPKQAMYLVGGVAALVLALIVNNWRLDSNRLPLVEKERDDANATVAQIRADAKIVADASAGYQSELAALRERNLGRPDTPVRLCRPGPASDVRVPAPERRLDGTAPSAGVVPPDAGVHPGPDIGPQLRRLAERADEVTAQGRGLQRAADGLAPN